MGGMAASAAATLSLRLTCAARWAAASSSAMRAASECDTAALCALAQTQVFCNPACMSLSIAHLMKVKIET